MRRFTLSFAIITAALLGFVPLAKAVTITVTQDPSTDLCANEKVELTLAPDDGGSYTYKWSWKDSFGVAQTRENQTLSDYPTSTTTYTYRVYDALNSLVASGTKTVNVSSAPTVTVDKSSAYVLKGGDVSITATGSAGTASYEWFDASDNSVGTSAALSLTGVTADATYRVVATGVNGCKSKPVTVNVYIYTVTASETKVCYGQPVTLTAQSATGSRYYWDDGTAGETYTVYPTGVPQTTYTVTIKDANDALVATQAINIDVLPLPKPTLTPSEQTICQGDEVTIQASGEGTFVWSNGANGNSLTVSPGATTTYWVQLTDANGCTSEKVYCTITVNPASTASINGPSTACVGSSVSLTISGGTPQRWFDSNGTTLATTATPYDYTPTAIGENIIYCEVKDANGCTTTAQKIITVEPELTPTIYGDLSICVGSPATLSVSTEGATYLWSTNENTQSITVSPTADKTYSVDVTKNGCTAHVEQKVSVNQKPTISITGGTTICKGSTASVTASATGGSGTYTYAWDDPNSTTSATLNVAPTATTKYTVTVTDDRGCSSTKSVTIVVEEETVPTILGATSVCKGVDFTLTVSSGDVFSWDDDASTTTASMTDNLMADRTYNVTVKKGSCTYNLSQRVTVLDGPVGEITGDNVICQGSSTRLTAPAGASYVWSTGANTQSIDVTAAGSYWVDVTKNGCTVRKDIVVSVNTPNAATITAADGTTLCPNAAVGLTLVASEGKAYKWSPTGEESREITAKPTTTTLYSVTVTDENGCESTASQLITVADEPTNLGLIASQTTVCKNVPITLTVVNAPSGSTITSSDGTVTGSAITVTPTVSKTITVTVKDASGCTYTLTQDITVLDAPDGTITGTLSFCQGSSTVLAAPVAPAGQTYTYLWNTGATDRTITVSTAGKYYVTVSNGSCSKTLDEVTVTQSTPTVPTITASKTTICAGETITLTASNYGAITQWSDGTQNLGNGATISVTPTVHTTYALTVTDINGCEAKAYQQIVVNTPISITLTGDNSVCEGGTLTVTASGAPSGSTYTWSKAGTLSNGDATLTFTPAVNETAVSVTVTPPTGCGTTKTHTFTVTPQPTGEITGITAVCSGGSTTLYAPAGESGTTYLWNNGEKTQAITTPALYTNTQYSVQITYPSGCTLSPNPVTVTVNPVPTGIITASNDIVCTGEQVELEINVAGATAWEWSNGTSGSNKAYITPTTSGNLRYYVDVTANGCTNRIYKDIKVVDKPTATIDKAASTSTFCEGEQATIVALGGVRYTLNGTTNTTGVFTVTPTATTTYTISVFNDNDCESLITHTVTKLTPTSEPTITANGNLELCVGDVRTFTISNGTIVNWDNGTNTPNYTYTALAGDIGTKTINATVLDANGCKKTISTTLKISAVPSVVIDATPATTICKGESVTLTATAGLKSYAWKSGEMTNQITVSPTTTTTYTVTATNEGGCSTTKDITITVLTPQTVSISGQTTACQGETVTLTAVGGTAWSWSHGLGNGNTATITAGSTTTYECEITDANGCTAKAQHTLTVKTVATPTISGNLNVCKGSSTTLTASQADAYEWKQGTTVLGTSQTLTLTDVQTSSDYTLTVTVDGCSASNTVRVKACELPTDAAITGADKVCEGETITLTANGAGTYKWGNGSTSNTITVTPTATDHIYQLTLTDVNGCTQTVQKNITVNARPSVSITGDDEVCLGNPITLTAYGSTTGTYLWDDGKTKTATLTVTPTVTRSYTVTFTDANGCTATDSKTVTVRTLSKPTIATTATDICKGESVTLTASGETGCTFTWPDLKRTGASVDVTPLTTTQYKVTATNASGCTADGVITITVHEQPTVTVNVDPISAAICSGETATITITGGTEYTCGGVTNTSGIFNVQPTATTPYNIVVKNAAGCVTETSQTITVYDKPIVSISGPTTACQGETVTLTAVGGTAWSWSHGLGNGNTATITAGSTTTYECEITDANGCTAKAQHTLTVKTVATPTISGNLNVCKGSSTTLTASQADAYEWKQGTTVLGTSQTLTLTDVQTSSDYTLTVTVDGCSASNTVRVKACELPTDAAITGADKVCEGETITLTANGAGTYKWGNGSTSNTITVTPTATDHIYQLTLTDVNGCTQTVQKNITVNARPSVSITGDDEVCLGNPITLTAYGSTTGTYLWDDGKTKTATLTVTPTVTRSYTVTFTDANGCTATDSKTVTVRTLSKPTIATTATDICKGESVTLTASGETGCTFTWPDLKRTGASVDVTPLTTTQYKVTATNASGCTADGVITITVHEQPTVTVNVDPISAAICSGETATITITGGTEYTCGGVTNTSGIFNVQPTATTPYNIVVKNAAGCVTETSQTITVYDKPIVSISGPTTACQGEEVTLTASGGTEYVWSNGTLSETNTFTVNGTTPVSGWVKGKNANGCWSDQVPYTITINQKPTIEVSGTMDICIGKSTTLTASGASTYVWSWTGGTKTGKTIEVSPTTNTDYTVEGTDANGCKNTATVTVKVYPEPVVVIAGPTEVCEDGEITLTATATAASGTAASGTFRWNNGSTNNSIKVSAAGTYEVTFTGEGGCTATAKHTVNTKTIVAKINDQIGGTTTICNGDEIALTASGGNTYLWDNGFGTDATIKDSPTTTTTYWATVTDNVSGCSKRVSHTVKVMPKPTLSFVGETTICYGSTTEITVSGAQDYVWGDGLGTGATIKVSPTATTKYTVTATDANGCKASGEIEVKVVPTPVAKITADKTEICVGDQVTLTASGGDTYEWGDGQTGSTITVSPTATTTYKVKTYKNGCPSAEVSREITVYDLPNVSIAASATTVCVGETVTLTASGATSYKWSTGATTQSITVTVNSDVTYEVTGKKNGCESTAKQTIKVNTPPTINISSNTGQLSICKGESITLTASGANTYVWANGLGNTPSITVSPTAEAYYTVEGTDANGCKATQSVTVKVYDKPNPTISGATEICEGTSTTLTAVWADAIAWEWSTGATTQSVNIDKAGSYWVIVTGKGGCSTKVDAIVTYKTPVSGSIAGPDRGVCKGETVTLTANGGKTYNWDDNAYESEKLVITNIQTTGTYWVTITGANGCTQRVSYTVFVNELPSVSIRGNLTFCEGASTELTAVGIGDVLWSTGETTPTITVKAEGTYSVTLTDANGCKASAQVEVKRNPLPVAKITGYTEVCEGESVTLTVSGAESYTWSTGATGESITVKPTKTTTYTVTPRTGNCTGDPVSHKVTVNTKPVITFDGDFEICAGEKAVITADGADSYTWGDGTTGATYTTAALDATTTFTVTGRINATGCETQKQVTVTVKPKPTISISGTTEVCAGESATLTVWPDGGTYKWSTGSIERTATFDNLISDKDYWVDVTIDGCTNRYTGTIKVNPIPQAVITTNTTKNTVCRGGSITLTASGGTSGTYTYLWAHDGSRSASVTVSPTADTRYSVTVIGAGNCQATATIDIEVLDLPIAKITADKNTVCEGDEVTLSASDGVKWQWYIGNTEIPNAIDQHYTVTKATYGTTTYKVAVENANGCRVEASYTLTVSRKPDATISGNLNICKGSSTTLTAPTSDSYLWNTGERTKSITVAPLKDTNYSVTVTVGDCQATSDAVTVVVNELPTPTLTADDNEICVGNSTTLRAGAGYSYYKWSTKDGVIKEGTNVQNIGVSPTEKTTYTVTVTDANGCVGSAQTTVDVTQVAAPTITVLSGSTTVCAGSEVVLQSSAAKTYQWSSNVDATQQKAQTVVVYPTQTTIYTVTTTNKKGCTSSKDITIKVTKLPTPKITGTANMCKGDVTGVELTATSDVEGATFVWSTGESAPSITVKPTKTTTYYVWASNGTCKNPTPDKFEVKVNDPPTAKITGKESICLGESVELEATGGISYLWKDVEGSAKTLSKITVTPTQTTTYICTVTDEKGCSIDVSHKVTVNALPTVSIISKTKKICRGESVTLSATGGNTYEWSTGETTNPIIVTPAYTTTYTVEATNANGCTSEAEITIEVVQEPKAHIDGPTTICSETEATLKVVSDDGRTYTCRWLHNNSTNLAEKVKPTSTTTYTVEVFDGSCSTTLTHEVTVNTLEDPKIDGPAQICLGQPTTLRVANEPNNFVSYRWSTGETTQEITVTPSVVGMSTYTVTCTDVNECTSDATIDIVVSALPEVTVTPSTDVICAGDNTITLTASGAGNGGTYNWYEDELATVPLTGGEGTSTYTFNNLDYTRKIYVVAITKLGCASAPKEYELVVTPKPTPTITSSVPTNVICEGGTIELTASDPDPDVTFKWADGTEGAYLTITKAGEYRVTATNKAGCSQDATINIINEPLPEASITPSIIAGEGAGESTSICAGTRVKLTANPESTPTLTYTYKWNTGSTQREITVNPTATTTYTVTVTSASGCEQTAELELKVNDFVEIEGPEEVCAGKPYVLNAVGKNLTYYEWTRNDVALTQFDNKASIEVTDTVPNGQPSAEYVYAVKAVYDNNCESETTYTVTVYAKPSDLTINGIAGVDALDSVCVGSPKQLSVIPTKGSSLTGATYMWTGVGITDQTAATQTITPTVAGNEKYSCQITMPGGCDTTVNITLKAVPLPELAVCPDTTICFGTSAKLYLTAKNNCPAGTTITWTSTNGGGGGSGDTVIVAPTATTTYTIEAKTPTPLNCSATTTVTVKVIPQQQPTVTPTPALICLDANGISEDDLTLTTADTDSEGRKFKAYKWYAEDDPTTTLGTTAEITVEKANVTTTRTYVVEVTTEEGCTATGKVEVPVSAKPSVSIKGEKQVCAGKSLVLEAESPINVARYEWTTNANPTKPFATTQSVTVWPTEDENTYYLTVYNDKGCSFEVNPAHKVDILGVPKPQIIADNNPICEGDDVTLTASDLNNGQCTMIWDDQSTAPTRTIKALTATTTYSVTLTNENGCSETVEYEVKVNPLPKLKITGNTQVCVGDSVLLTVQDANGADNTYSWTGGKWKSAKADNSQVWVYPTNTTDSTEYCVTSVDANKCKGKEVCHKILAFAKPIARINGKQMATDTICVGESLILEATGGTKFKWSTNAESAQITTPIYNSSKTYIFWVDVYNEANCVERDSIWIYVAPLPTAYITTSDKRVCEGTEVTLRASDAPSGSTYTYAWTNNTGATIDNANQQEIKVKPAVTTTYTVTVTDVKTGCYRQISQPIDVDPQAKVNFDAAAPDSICETDEFTLEIKGDVTGQTIVWEKQKDGATVDVSAWKGMTKITDTPKKGNYVYRATLTNQTTTCQTVLEHKLTVSRVPKPSISVTSGATTICQGEEVTLRASNDEDIYTTDKVKFVWKVGNDIISTSDNQREITVKPNKTTIYTLQIEDLANHCIDVADVTINVNPQPNVTLVVQYPDGATPNRICQTDSITLRIVGETVGLTTRWFKGTTPITAWDDKFVVKDAPDASTDYSVTVENALCELKLDTTIKVNRVPNPKISSVNGETTICQGNQIELKANEAQETGYTYKWTSSNAQETIETPTTQNITVSPTATTTYTYTVTSTSTGCSRFDTLRIVVNRRPEATLEVKFANTENTEGICAGEPFTLNVVSTEHGTLATTWYANEVEQTAWADMLSLPNITADDTTTYRVEVRFAGFDCSTTLEKTVNMQPVPDPTVQVQGGGSSTICEGSELTLEAIVAKDSKFTYAWQSSTKDELDAEGNAVDGQAGQTITVRPTTPITYYAYVVTDQNTGCSRTGQIRVDVNLKPKVTLVTGGNTLAKDTLVCGGEPVEFRVDGDLTGLTFAWYKDNVLQTETSAHYTDTPEATATYHVIVTNETTACGTTINDLRCTVTVNVMPVPTIELVGAEATNHICAGTSITLKASENLPHDRNIYGYQWTENGRPLSGVDQQITRTPKETTTYIYTIVDNRPDGGGCTRSVDTTIYVYELPKVTLEKSLADGAIYCAGDPITLSVKAGEGTNAGDLTYTWLRNGETLSETSATLTDYPTGAVSNESDTTYNYEVIVENKDSHCQADPTGLTFSVTVAPLPQPSISAFDNNGDPITKGQEVCPDRSIRLQATNLSGKLFRYTWYSQNQDDNDITTTDKPNEVRVSPSTTTTYTVEIENLTTKCKRMATYTVNVLKTPKIKIVSSAQIDAEGNSVACLNAPQITLTVVQEDGTAIDEYKYYFTWTDDTGTFSSYASSITLPTTEVSEHTYTVAVTNYSATLQCPVTAKHTVQIQRAPVVTIDAYTDGTLLADGEWVCAGEAVTLQATQQPRTSYEWSDNFGEIYSANSENNAREIIVYPQKTTTYTVKVTSLAGCSYETQRTIYVNPKPVVTISGPTSFCLEAVDGTFTLKATSTPYSRNNTYFVWMYTVDGAEREFSGPDSITIAPQKAGTYTFYAEAYHTANDKKCASDLAVHTVRVNAVPDVRNSDLKVVSSLDSTANACINTPFELEATAGYTKYVFGLVDKDTEKVIPKQEGTNNIFSTTVTTEGDWTYYCDFFNDAGCYKRVEITVHINPMPSGISITATGDLNNEKTGEATICQGKEITLTGNDPSGNQNRYEWIDTDGKTYSGQAIMVSPISTTTYTLTVTNKSGCQLQSSFKVNVVPMDKLTVTANGTTDSIAVCAGSADKITLRVTGSSASTYNWTCQELNITRSNQPSSITVDAPDRDVTWIVEALSSANKSYNTSCNSVGSVKVHVLPNPDNTGGRIDVNGGEAHAVCAGSTATLTGNHTDAVTYRWSTGEVKTEIQVLIPAFESDTTVTYWAIGRNALGCENTTDTMKISLLVKPQPEPRIASETTCYEGQTLRLEAEDKTLDYRWYDENGDEVSKKYFYEFVRDEAGIYNCKLTARNDIGCETTITVSVTVQKFEPVVVGLAYVCSGQSTKLWVDGCSTAAGYQFRWRYAGNEISRQDTVEVALLGGYTVEVTTPWNAVGTGQITISQSETPAIKFSASQPACQGDRYAQLSYSVTGGLPTYYSLGFGEEARNVGFQDVADAAMTSNSINIDLPSNVPSGTYQVRVSLKNSNGCESAWYDVKFSVGEDMVEEMWDDVLICNDLQNEFTAYQWYKNGERITGATMQYYSELGGFSGDYYVIAYNGSTSVASCVVQYAASKQEVAISPNPLKRYQTLHVTLPFSADVLFGSRIEIIDAIGRTLYTIDRVEAENGIVIGYPSGVYMVRVSLNDGRVLTEKFVVQ